MSKKRSKSLTATVQTRPQIPRGWPADESIGAIEDNLAAAKRSQDLAVEQANAQDAYWKRPPEPIETKTLIIRVCDCKGGASWHHIADQLRRVWPGMPESEIRDSMSALVSEGFLKPMDGGRPIVLTDKGRQEARRQLGSPSLMDQSGREFVGANKVEQSREYTMADLRKMTGYEQTMLSKCIRDAGVRPNKRGERNRTFLTSEVVRILQHIIDEGKSKHCADKCKAELDSLMQITI